MNEKAFWVKVRAALAEQFFLQRLENMVGDGVPDVLYHSRLNGATGMLELKSRESLPARSDSPIFPDGKGLRPAQIAWMHCRGMCNANVWILAQCADRVWLTHGRWAREFNLFSVAEFDARAAWKGRVKDLHLLACRTYLTKG